MRESLRVPMQADPAQAPLIVFDECHKNKHLVPPEAAEGGGGAPSLTGFAAMLLQRVLPHAQVMYSSATGVSEPLNMVRAARLAALSSHA